MTTVIEDSLIETICQRLGDNKQVRRRLPGDGRIHIDRQLPFLVVYRRPTDHADAGTESLARSHASYLVVSDDKALRPSVKKLVTGVVETLASEFGNFLIVEIWSEAAERLADGSQALQPAFRIVTARKRQAVSIAETLEDELSLLQLRYATATVTLERGAKPAPSGLLPLLTPQEADLLNCQLIGLAIRPVYRDVVTDTVYPLVLRLMIQKVTHELQQTFFEFARTQTSHEPHHYQSLGRRAVVKAVWDVDRRLAEINDSFDFLLGVTPINTHAAWLEFQRHRYQKPPVFRYRPHYTDPTVMKRRLWSIRIDRLEDPTLGFLFRQKREELDITLTMLMSMNTSRFLYGSMQLYGELDDNLVRLARTLLETLPSRTRDDASAEMVDANAFALKARAELDYYRQQYPELPAKVQVRDDLFSGLMVSRGNLLIGKDTLIPQSRVEALLQHEVGTHIVTYFNGQAQPFRQLYTGLAGYDELQEGLAVLSEFLVGGLSRSRLRLLAARVLAAHSLIDGASYVETYRLLNREYRFRRRLAFTITQRVYRGGGLTKDAIYLRGLVHMLDYLRDGGQIDPLLVGKIAEEHIPIIQELQWRNVLQASLAAASLSRYAPN